MNSPLTNADLASNGQVVVFPPDRGIGVLAVDPPFPAGFKPQSDGALGININMVHGDRDGLLVYILAYLNMAIGDYIKVYIETKNASVAEFSVTEAHFDAEGNAKNIPFYISAKDMEARFAPLLSENKEFWFEVERVSGNGTEQSPPVPLFYKYPAPGEPDTDGGKPFNQGLKLPVASESFVDQSVIDDGMFVTVPEYFNQSIGDVVVLAFGSLLLEITVTALGDVVFELTPGMLATLKPTNSLVVRWEVFDVVENSSGWSDALILTFKPGIVLLAAPIFEPADTDNVVHHDGLAGGAMAVLVTGVFAINDLIELTLEGLTKGGDPVTHTYSRTLTAASRTVNFPVENEWVRNLIGGSLHASYKLTRAGKTQPSKPADVTITGTSQQLGLPIVEPLVDNKLPVDTAMATVRVAEYWPLKEGATVEARWQTTDQDGIAALFIFRLIVTDPTQPVTFQVPAKYIAPYSNTPLTVQCTVTNPGEVEVFSNLLQLMFGEEAKIELLPPFLVKPAVSLIDPLGDLPTVRVEFLAAIAEDRARLVERNAPVGSDPFPLTLLNQNKRANFVLNREFIVARQGKSFEVFWNLNRGGKKVASSPPLKLTVKPLVLIAPTIPDVPGPNLDFDDIPDSGLRIQVKEFIGMSPGQWISVKLTSAGENYETLPQEVKAVAPLVFQIPRSVFVANPGQPVEITYLVSSSTSQVNGVRSPPLNVFVLADTWRDSITDFTSNAGNWAFGPASSDATIGGGVYQNLTYKGTGNSGVLLRQTFQLKKERTYRFTYSVANISPQPSNVPPIISVTTSSGITILGAFHVPRTGAWYSQTNTFKVPANGSYTIYLNNHQDLGGYADARGGNDFRLDNIYLQRS